MWQFENVTRLRGAPPTMGAGGSHCNFETCPGPAVHHSVSLSLLLAPGARPATPAVPVRRGCTGEPYEAASTTRVGTRGEPWTGCSWAASNTDRVGPGGGGPQRSHW